MSGRAGLIVLGPERKIVTVFKSHLKIVILSEVARALCGLRSRRTPKKPVLAIPLGPFQPQTPREKQHGVKRSKQHGRGRNLRGPSTPALAKCARSSAQDDDFGWGLEKLLRMNVRQSGYAGHQRASQAA
jgi:hypothetical protein